MRPIGCLETTPPTRPGRQLAFGFEVKIRLVGTVRRDRKLQLRLRVISSRHDFWRAASSLVGGRIGLGFRTINPHRMVADDCARFVIDGRQLKTSVGAAKSVGSFAANGLTSRRDGLEANTGADEWLAIEGDD